MTRFLAPGTPGYKIWIAARAFFFTLSKLPYLLLILVIGWYALDINDQCHDMMYAFRVREGNEIFYLAGMLIMLVAWAGAVWNTARVLLTAASELPPMQQVIQAQDVNDPAVKTYLLQHGMNLAVIQGDLRDAIEFSVKWVPRILAIVPYMFFLWSYMSTSNEDSPTSYIPLLVVVMAMVHFFALVYRRQVWHLIRHGEWKDINNQEAYAAAPTGNLNEALDRGKVILNTRATLAITLLALLAVIIMVHGQYRIAMPGLVLMTFLLCYTMICLLVNYCHYRVKVPVFLCYVLVSLVVFSRWNNNHDVNEIVPEKGQENTRLESRKVVSDTAYAHAWLTSLMDELDSKSANPVSGSGVDTPGATVYVVAAEGGGSRNAYWTYKVLETLNDSVEGFYRRTFAATGVSGGAIGLGYFYSGQYFRDSILKHYDSDAFRAGMDDVVSGDYLSRVTFYLMGPDLFQKFLPFGFGKLDRARQQEIDMDKGFRQPFEEVKLSLDSDFLARWYGPGAKPTSPALLFNTTFNQDGRKGIFSPFRLTQDYYSDAVDLLTRSDRSVPFIEAMYSCARFPIISAPGRIWRTRVESDCSDANRIPMGDISDGGGYENTGVQTAEQTTLMLKDVIRRYPRFAHIKVQIVYIGSGVGGFENSPGTFDSLTKIKDHFHRANDMKWLGGAAGSLFNRITSSHAQTTALDSSFKTVKIGLKMKDKENDQFGLPLGWYLSTRARQIIQKQASDSAIKAFYGRLEHK